VPICVGVKAVIGGTMTNDDDERARRHYAVEQAIAHNSIEGIETPAAALAIFDLWIAGKISSDECTRGITREADELVRAMRDVERYSLRHRKKNGAGVIRPPTCPR
jgi:hypothetical protein